MHEIRIGTSNAAQELACEMMHSVGRADFARRVLASLRDTLGPELVSIFAYAGPMPMLLGHETLAARFDEATAIRHYMGGMFVDDPAIRHIQQQLAPGATAALYMRRADVPTLSYRRHCYENSHIADRFTVACRTLSGDAIALNFYRGEARGPLSDRQLDLGAGLVPLLAAGLTRHHDLTRTAAPDGAEAARELLVSRFPALTRREAQCAGHAVVGASAADTARALGLKPSSVITHRKRAYARLGIGSQRALIALFHTAH